MSKRKGKKKSDPTPDFRIKRRAHGRVRRVRKSRVAVHEGRILDAHRNAIKVLALVLALVLIVIIVSRFGPTPNYVTCSRDQPKQQYSAWVFLQLGDATGVGTQQFTISKNMGLSAIPGGCSYPVSVHDDDPATRSYYYVKIAVSTPYTSAEHQVTLGDFFASWGYWLGNNNASYPAQPIAFSSTRMAYWTSPNVEVQVRESSDLLQIWSSPHTVGNAQYTPILAGHFYLVWVHDPMTNLTSQY